MKSLHSSLKKSSGFALPAVIFMMVIVVLLIGYMVRMLNTQSAINDMQLLGTRAFWAAKAGAEWAAYRINQSGACASDTLTVDSFTVTVSCASSSYVEAGNTVTVFEVNVDAQHPAGPGSADYVSRQLNLVLNAET